MAELLQKLRKERDEAMTNAEASIAAERRKVGELIESLRVDAIKQKLDTEEIVEKVSKTSSGAQAAYFKIRRKYWSLMKKTSKLQEKLQRGTWSPWLHKTQQALLTRRHGNRGVKWHPQMIQKGLVLKMKCGTSGYDAFVKEIPLLPSARTLRQHVQFVKFDSGLLEDIFEILGMIMEEFPDYMKDCVLVVDEMAITEGVRYCTSLKKFVGQSTFPTHSGRANKALVFLLAGLAKRWKISVGVYFCSKRAPAVEPPTTVTPAVTSKNPNPEVMVNATSETPSVTPQAMPSEKSPTPPGGNEVEKPTVKRKKPNTEVMVNVTSEPTGKRKKANTEVMVNVSSETPSVSPQGMASDKRPTPTPQDGSKAGETVGKKKRVRNAKPKNPKSQPTTSEKRPPTHGNQSRIKKRTKNKDNATGEAFKNIIDEILLKSYGKGANIWAIISDMGPDNLAMWSAYGVKAQREGPVKSSFPHPGCPDKEVHIFPDSLHLFKAIKTALEKNGFFKLPQDIVDQEGLPSNIVSYEHIRDLLEFEENFQLKVAFRLKPWNVDCKKHFNKMKVGTARAVLCHRTSVGLEMLAEEKNDASYKTTAWFVELLNTFFDLVTSRHKSMAFSHENQEVYDKAVALILKVSYVFQHMTVGKDEHFKPCQRGMRVLCHSLLNLVAFLLNERNFKFVLGGRTCSDCIENLFSMIRLGQAIPHAVALLQILKVITLSQCSEAVRGSSYDYDESEPITGNMLEVARARAAERASVSAKVPERLDDPIPELGRLDFDQVPRWEKLVIYDMAGSVIHHLKNKNVTLCTSCITATLHRGEEPHMYSTFTTWKEYTYFKSSERKGPLQVFVSDEIFTAILSAEVTMRRFSQRVKNFKTTDVLNYFVDNLMYVWKGTYIPDCHNICRLILEDYVESRLKELGRMDGECVQAQKAASNTVQQRASKSTAMRESASQMAS